MKRQLLIAAGLLLGACSSGGNIANNTVTPPSVVTETPGDWAALNGMVGRTPADSGLFTNSSISVDLDALLGPTANSYRRVAETGSALTREGPVLVTVAADRTSFLLIHPADHSLQAGLKQGGKWRVWTTPAATVPEPPAIKQLLNS